MSDDVEVTHLIEVAANEEQQIVLKGLTASGGTTLIRMSGDNLDILMNALPGLAPVLGRGDQQNVAMFFYSGVEIKTPPPDHPGLAILILKCLPERSLYFLLSAESLRDLAKHCLTAADSPLLATDRKPS